MADLPIIFSGPMVRALLAGRKTQTRRLATSPLRRVEVGDRLYVRESMYLWSLGHDCGIAFAADGTTRQTGLNTGEIPDASLAGYFKMADQSGEKRVRISRPSIHMPRWVSRITLLVEDVRVGPLRSISESDAVAEGLDVEIRTVVADNMPPYKLPTYPHYSDFASRYADPRLSYGTLWNNLHTKDGERWDDNPSVVALTFRVEHGNIDNLKGEAA